MTEEEIREGNILIHKFMGRDDEAFYKVSEYENGYHAMSDFVPGKHLCYHRSWDLLMEVVEKCRSTKAFNDIVVIKDIHGTDTIIQGLYTQDIGLVYKGINKFIKWHNQQKKK